MQGFRKQGNALLWEQYHEILQIEPWGADSLRVRATMEAAIRSDLPGSLLDPAPADVEIEIEPQAATICNGVIGAEVSSTGKLRFFNPRTGEDYFEEDEKRVPYGWPPTRYYKNVAGGLVHLETRFKAYENEHIYGMGQQIHGRLDHKGCVIELLHRNTQETIPFFISTRGYGFLWHNPGVGRVQFGHDRTVWISEGAYQFDYWVTAMDTPAQILEHFADAVGHAPMLPEWAAGFWQCKLRYDTQEELLEVAREHKRRGLPLSVIVADFFHWSIQGEWQFDPERWPDPAGMVRELEEMGVKLMVSIWPTVNPLSRYFNEMEQRGLLVRAENGRPLHMRFVDTKPEGPVYLQYYDSTNPEARQFIWERACEGYYRYGIKVFWLDESEPDMWPSDPANLRYHLGNGLAVTNLYPMMHAKAFYDGLRSQGETEIINLSRSAWAGSQRYGAAVWSGDIESTWESLRTQVRAGLNIGLSGIPWWTTDIGGFFFGDPENASFRELIVRWFQYGVFCPLFRLHGFRAPAIEDPVPHGGPNEVWSFGEAAYEIIKGLLFLRERLRPYIMEQMRTASANGAPPMRPLFFDFPRDAASYQIEDQFMFGPDLLVAPVTFEGARGREVYLPSGTSWKDAWTGKVYPGGQTIHADAPLEKIPLFLRGEADGKTYFLLRNEVE